MLTDKNDNNNYGRLTTIIDSHINIRVKLVNNITNQYELLLKYYNDKSKYQIIMNHCHLEIKNIIQCKKKLNQKFKNMEHKKKELQNLLGIYERKYMIELKKANKKAPKSAYMDKWDEYINKSLDEIDDDINTATIKMQSLFYEKEKVDRYHELTKKIERLQQTIQNEQISFERRENQIQTIKEQWLPLLTENVNKISKTLSNLFSQFGASGKVSIIAPPNERYEEYSICIETKFRKKSPWTKLSGHSHSGGEKSVSTMLYLLSLQTVTTVPFRVVDEINQGMDPTNERRIMTILNHECKPRKGNTVDDKRVPQYFVVTPKLLPNLHFNKYVSVFIIYNGPFQIPQQKWNIDQFLNTQSPGFTQKYQSSQTHDGVTNLYTKNNSSNNNNNNNNNDNDSNDDSNDSNDDDSNADSNDDDSSDNTASDDNEQLLPPVPSGQDSDS